MLYSCRPTRVATVDVKGLKGLCTSGTIRSATRESRARTRRLRNFAASSAWTRLAIKTISTAIFSWPATRYTITHWTDIDPVGHSACTVGASETWSIGNMSRHLRSSTDQRTDNLYELSTEYLATGVETRVDVHDCNTRCTIK